MPRLRKTLPPELRLGLNRDEAAQAFGIGTSLFDRAVKDGRLPQPRAIYDRLVWDIEELVAAFKAWPHRDDDDAEPADDPWAKVAH